MPLMSYTFHNIQLQVIIGDHQKAAVFHKWLEKRFLRPEDHVYKRDQFQIHCITDIVFRGLPVAKFDFKMDEATEGITVNGENASDVMECINRFTRMFGINNL